METFTTIYFFIFLILPIIIGIIGYLLYTIIHPKESFMLGRRWQFKNKNIEPTEEVIKSTRIQGIISLVSIILFVIYMIFQLFK